MYSLWIFNSSASCELSKVVRWNKFVAVSEVSQNSARTRCLVFTNPRFTAFLFYLCLVQSTGVTLHFYCFRFEHPGFVQPILELFRSDTLNFSLSCIFTIYLQSLGLYACKMWCFLRSCSLSTVNYLFTCSIMRWRRCSSVSTDSSSSLVYESCSAWSSMASLWRRLFGVHGISFDPQTNKFITQRAKNNKSYLRIVKTPTHTQLKSTARFEYQMCRSDDVLYVP